MSVCHIPWFRNKTGHILTHFKNIQESQEKRKKMLQVVLIYLLPNSRVQGGYLTCLRFMDSQKAGKELGIFHLWWFTLMGIFLWGKCSLQISLIFNHSTFACFQLAQKISFNKSFYFSFKKHALTSLRTQHFKQQGVPVIFLNKCTLQILENLVFPKLFVFC